ncbi:unnamed protein product, partial [Closterium sp. Yama58-4]
MGYGRLLLFPGSTTVAENDSSSSSDMSSQVRVISRLPSPAIHLPPSNSRLPSPAFHLSLSISCLLSLAFHLMSAVFFIESLPDLLCLSSATGKGAEQAQQHEVLGWKFEVGEAEDPLPFWAANSFSFPYITPATPLLTRGSTRKRFFAADLSIAAADVFVGFTSAALIPDPGRLPSPVALSSWAFRFTDTDPCKGSPVLPCGMGACTKAPAPWDPSVLLPSCKCPFNLPSFQPSFLSGLPSCFPDSFTCRQFPRNPCAPGVCIDDVDGSYSCLCTSPFFPLIFPAKGTARCSL